MAETLTTQQGSALLEQVLIGGDLSKLSAQDRVMYYKQVCESIGLNPLTKPFEYITLNGKLTLYALRACTEQLRQLHGVSVEIIEREMVEDCYVVTARATDAKGRKDESIGAVPIKGLSGEARSNAMMRGETKAKRRVTLSICGLGMLDETEVGSIPSAVIAPSAGALSALPIAKQETIAETAAQVKVLLADDQMANAYALWQNSKFDTDEQVAFWSLLDSKQKGVLGRMGEAERNQAKGVISEPQKKRLEARIKELKLKRDEIKAYCQREYGVDHFADLTPSQYQLLDAELDSHVPSTASARAPNPQTSSPAEPVAGATISEAQQGVILDLLTAHEVDLKAFLLKADIKKVSDLRADRYDGAVAWIKRPAK
mgnify:FL=1